jgi:ParB-like chromosome segregation protein Spo0J
MWPLDRLRPYERNARTHSREQLAQIAASIQEFGFTNPILVDGTDGILAGHGRLAAAKDMGLKEVPVIVLDHLSPEQRRAYVIADNQLALNAGWDTDLLQQEVAALNLADFDLGLLGFDDDRIAALLDPDGIGQDEPPTGADDPGKEYQQKYAVAVECADEAEQETVYEKLNGEGYTCKLLTV